MKERAILFGAPMVRALLDGTKTQTRRIVRPQPSAVHDGEPYWYVGGYRVWGYRPAAAVPLRAGGNPLPCPYGQVGDRLWVREAWAPGDDMVFGAAKDDPETVLYRADKAALHWDGQEMRTPMDTYAFAWDAVRWKPSIHMPRWASRITLEVTEVRVECLQEISEADAIAEGVTPYANHPGRFLSEHRPGLNFPSATAAYRDLWESINGPGSWDANHWCWVITFRRV